MGILSVLAQAFYEAEYFTVPEVFLIRHQKVDSGVMRLRRKLDYSLPCDENYSLSSKTAFQQRRKRCEIV